MDLKTQTLEQLKALAYDQMVLQEQAQRNIQVINQEIALRNTQAEPIVEPAEQVEPVKEDKKVKE